MRIHLTSLAVFLVILSQGACSSTPRRPRPVTPNVRSVPPILRNTVGAEVTINGIEPVLVGGYGLVVGLNGTGGRPLPEAVAVTMEREMGLMQIGKAGEYDGTAIAGKTPQQLLRDPGVAVVMVQAAIPPGAPIASGFDAYVSAINATSLEGGLLWTTDLRITPAGAPGPSLFEGYQTHRLAQAHGPVFINPFSDPAKDADGVSRRVGRVLMGGTVTSPMRLQLLLDNPDHVRAATIVSALNSRFPREPGDPARTALGQSNNSIAVHVPWAYRHDPAEFIGILRHVQIDQSFPEEYARRYAEGIRAEPALADELSWCLTALGPRALPFIRGLYDSGDLGPQIAGLRAGARLGDPRAAETLKALVTQDVGSVRTEAIALLSRVDAGPTVDVTLRGLLSSPELLVRVCAYEALAERAERHRLDALIADQERARREHQPGLPLGQLDLLAVGSLPARSLQGIQRRVITDKFLLDIVPAGDPLIYVSQQGLPKLVLFGADPSLSAPLLVSAWEDRFLLSADAPDQEPRLYYRDYRTGRVTQQTVRRSLAEFVEFMAREPSIADPRPGLDLSYSEVVGALYAIHQDGGTNAAFATERDRLMAQLLEAQQTIAGRERPETTRDQERVIVFTQPGVPAPTPGDQPRKPTIVPIQPTPGPKNNP